jgi:hypothetical protein
MAGSFHYKNAFAECMFLFRVDFHVHYAAAQLTLKKQMSHDRLLLWGAWSFGISRLTNLLWGLQCMNAAD